MYTTIFWDVVLNDSLDELIVSIIRVATEEAGSLGQYLQDYTM